MPVHRGALAQAQAMAALQAGDHPAALAHVRQAIAVDPALTLYRLEEANILGLMAGDDASYLNAAIQAHEAVLARTPTWDLGWHNLAALYAQAGRLEDAIRSERQAVEWGSLSIPYRFRLGDLLLVKGEETEAITAFKEVLRENPVWASSKYWSQPDTPERQRVLQQVIAEMEGIEKRLDLAIYAGDLGEARRIAATLTETTISAEMAGRVEALWPKGIDGPACVTCYYIRGEKLSLEAEQRLFLDAPFSSEEQADLEKLIRQELFENEGKDSWAWYQLARLEGTGSQLEEYLSLGVGVPADYRWSYPVTYGTQGAVLQLPLAPLPRVSPVRYQPWIELGEHYAVNGEWEKAQHVFEEILKLDPYDYDVQSRAAEFAAQASAEVERVQSASN